MESNIPGPINLGNPSELTIKEIANIIIKKINPSLSINFKELPADDPRRRNPNIEKAKKLLNWEPEIDLSEGLDKTIDYFKNFN